MILLELIDHLHDGMGLARPTARLGPIEPPEARLRVVSPVRLGQKQHETLRGSEVDPAGSRGMVVSGLTAAVEGHDDRRRFGQIRRRDDEHPQVTGVGPEVGDFGGFGCVGGHGREADERNEQQRFGSQRSLPLWGRLRHRGSLSSVRAPPRSRLRVWRGVWCVVRGERKR